MEQYLVELKISDTVLTSAADAEQAEVFAIDDIVSGGDYTEEDIEVISVRKLES